jgi:hypothetical protein
MVNNNFIIVFSNEETGLINYTLCIVVPILYVIVQQHPAVFTGIASIVII